MENFLTTLAEINDKINAFIWVKIGLVLLIGTGILMTCCTKWFQISHIGHWWQQTIGGMFRRDSGVHAKTDKKTISQFQALCTALAATIGTGNIAGVSAAIVIGGPGAVFWMWVAAFFGMMTNFSENVLGIYYRRRNSQGEWSGGAMYYLKDGLGGKKHCKTIGSVLAVLFSIFAILASFGIGNMGQINKIVLNMKSAFFGGVTATVGGMSVVSLACGIVLMILAALIVFALGLLISTLSSYLMGADRLTTALTNAAQFGAEAVEQAYISFFEHYSVSAVAVVLVVALEIMSYMVSVGFVIFSLHVSRDETAEIGNLFDGFGIFFRALWLAILQGLFVFLWSLLLFVPGIVAAYRYRQAIYLLLDHPEKSAWQCLRESGALMRGHKWELFVLDLSFLGWMLLSAMFAPVSIWLDPYRAITNANYYNRLVGAQGGPRIYEGSFTDIPNDPQS